MRCRKESRGEQVCDNALSYSLSLSVTLAATRPIVFIYRVCSASERHESSEKERKDMRKLTMCV